MATPHPNPDGPDAPPKEPLATAETHFAPESAVAAATVAESLFGSVVDGRYRIVRALGEGGMGAVFVAEHLKLGSEVALKVIRPELMKNAELAARFAREAMASARLNHPHVASALDYGILPDGSAYLVMQLARGRSLRDLIDTRRAFPWPLATEIAAQIADAAAAAHALGIVHRDLKPDNVFVEERDDGSVLCQVLDFGIARVQVEGESTNDAAAPGRALTTIGTIMGTPGYMAPEQAMGQAADARADLYALGVLLAEMLSGEPLFEAETFTAILTAQLTASQPRVAEQTASLGLPPALDALLGALVAPETANRPERANEVRDELRRIARANEDRDMGVRRAGEVPRVRLSTMTAPEGPHAAEAPGAARALDRARAVLPARIASLRNTWIVGGLLVLGVALAGLSVAAFIPGDAAAPSADTGQVGASSALPALPAPLRPLVEAATRFRADSEIERAYADLLEDEDREVRRAAAGRILAHAPAESVPGVARAAAELEVARSCRDRQAAVLKLGELGDESVLPVLDRLAATPKRGCGFLNAKDCHRCLRGDLDAVIARLRGGSAP